MGSFLATVMMRRRTENQWVFGRSHCDGCDRQLVIWSLIPLVSWVAQRGRAACCGIRISAVYPATELICLCVPLTAMIAGFGSSSLTLVVACLLGWSLVALALIDLSEMRLPDALTLPLTAAGLALAATGNTNLWWHIGGAVIGYASLTLVAITYRRLRGREGLGLGDANLLMAGGAWCGALPLPQIVLVGCIVTFGLVFARRVRTCGPCSR